MCVIIAGIQSVFGSCGAGDDRFESSGLMTPRCYLSAVLNLFLVRQQVLDHVYFVLARYIMVHCLPAQDLHFWTPHQTCFGEIAIDMYAVVGQLSRESENRFVHV